MLDQPVPNPVAKNPNVHTHKVFASVGLILIGVIVILSVLAYIYRDQVADLFDTKQAEGTTTTKVSTSSATKENNAKTSDETADWATYTNTTYKFGFKYPKDWKITENPATGYSSVVDLTSPDAKVVEHQEGTNIENGTIVRFMKPDEFGGQGSVMTYAKKKNGSFVGSNDVFASTTVDGKPAVRFDSELEGAIAHQKDDFVSTTYYILNGDMVYDVFRMYVSGEQLEHEATFKKIMSTYKFL